MNADEIEKSLDDYEVAHRTYKMSDSKAEVAWAEKAMARIEERFQRAGLDINEYL